MAFARKKPEPPKEEPVEKRMPDFVIRAKDANGRWMNIGAMWSANVSGKPGWSIKINQPPMGWNGDALAMEPLPAKEDE